MLRELIRSIKAAILVEVQQGLERDGKLAEAKAKIAELTTMIEAMRVELAAVSAESAQKTVDVEQAMSELGSILAEIEAINPTPVKDALGEVEEPTDSSTVE